jgi:hypothetical protein
MPVEKRPDVKGQPHVRNHLWTALLVIMLHRYIVQKDPTDKVLELLDCTSEAARHTKRHGAAYRGPARVAGIACGAAGAAAADNDDNASVVTYLR